MTTDYNVHGVCASGQYSGRVVIRRAIQVHHVARHYSQPVPLLLTADVAPLAATVKGNAFMSHTKVLLSRPELPFYEFHPHPEYELGRPHKQ